MNPTQSGNLRGIAFGENSQQASTFKKTSTKLQLSNASRILSTMPPQSWFQTLPSYIDPVSGPLPLTIAVGGGKGGTGKSFLSANLSSQVAEFGLKVLAIDFDIGGANLHNHFGVNFAKVTMEDYFENPAMSLAEVPLKTNIPNLSIACAGRGAGILHDDEATAFEQIARFWKDLVVLCQKEKYQVVLFDLGAGTHGLTMDIFSLAQFGIMSVLPEPTSIENAYAFAKVYMMRLIHNFCQRHKLGKDVRQELIAIVRSQPKGFTQPQSHIQRLSQAQLIAEEMRQILMQALSRRSLGVVINQARTLKEADIGKSMELVIQRYFGFQSKFLGFLNFDETVWRCVQNRRLLLTDFPHGNLAKRIRDITFMSVQQLVEYGQINLEPTPTSNNLVEK